MLRKQTTVNAALSAVENLTGPRTDCKRPATFDSRQASLWARLVVDWH